MKTTLGAIAILLAVAPGVSSAQTQTERAGAVVRATDYCLSVARAALAGADPVDGGPEGFTAHRRDYGALEWRFGTNPNGKPEIIASPGGLCTVFVQPGADVKEPLAAWMSTQAGFQPDNAEGTAFFAPSPGGWVRIGWAEVGPMDNGEAGSVMVLVQTVEGSN